MSLLTLAEMRALHETDLEDDALQALLDAAEEEIVSHAGAHASASDFFSRPLSASVFLKRRAASIDAVTERVRGEETELAADDYRLADTRELIRRDDGTNPRSSWGDEVTVEYVPVSDLDTRKRVQADLVKLSAQYQALRSESSGDLQQTFPEYQAERQAILSQLSPGLAIA